MRWLISHPDTRAETHEVNINRIRQIIEIPLNPLRKFSVIVLKGHNKYSDPNKYTCKGANGEWSSVVFSGEENKLLTRFNVEISIDNNRRSHIAFHTRMSSFTHMSPDNKGGTFKRRMVFQKPGKKNPTEWTGYNPESFTINVRYKITQVLYFRISN